MLVLATLYLHLAVKGKEPELFHFRRCLDDVITTRRTFPSYVPPILPIARVSRFTHNQYISAARCISVRLGCYLNAADGPKVPWPLGSVALWSARGLLPTSRQSPDEDARLPSTQALRRFYLLRETTRWPSATTVSLGLVLTRCLFASMISIGAETICHSTFLSHAALSVRSTRAAFETNTPIQVC